MSEIAVKRLPIITEKDIVYCLFLISSLITSLNCFISEITLLELMNQISV